jgi:hypothetical protein
MAQMAVEQHGMSMSEAEDARIREEANGANEPLRRPNFVLQGEPTPMGTLSPAAAWPVTTGERAAATQAMQDDDLLAQLASVGLAAVVIDENTDFTTLPSLT